MGLRKEPGPHTTSWSCRQEPIAPHQPSSGDYLLTGGTLPYSWGDTSYSWGTLPYKWGTLPYTWMTSGQGPGVPECTRLLQDNAQNPATDPTTGRPECPRSLHLPSLEQKPSTPLPAHVVQEPRPQEGACGWGGGRQTGGCLLPRVSARCTSPRGTPMGCRHLHRGAWPSPSVTAIPEGDSTVTPRLQNPRPRPLELIRVTTHEGQTLG